MPVVDLPEPEEVFGVPRLGRKEVVKFFLNFMFDQLTGETSSSSEPMAAALARWRPCRRGPPARYDPDMSNEINTGAPQS
ncbi:MAG: hypothetical protein ACJ745_22585, partial [Actinomycetes bacterium]